MRWSAQFILRPRPWLVGLAAFALALLLFGPALGVYFMGDDWPMLAKATQAEGNLWLAAFVPQGNGFVRPFTLLIILSVYKLCGLEPVSYHLVCLAIHAANAALVAALARRLFPARPGAAWLAAGVFTVQYAASGAVLFCNGTCDPLMTLGFLIGLLGWDAWLSHGRRAGLVWMLVGFIFALLGKEAGIVFPGLMFVWTLLRLGWDRSRLKRPAVWVAGVGVVALAWLVMSLAFQSRASGSYFKDQQSGVEVVASIQRLLTYIRLAWWPFAGVAHWPGGHVWPALYWQAAPRGTSYVVALIMAIGTLCFLRAPRGRWGWGLALCAAVPLVLAACVKAPAAERYVYPALPFVSLVVAGWLLAEDSPLRRPGVYSAAFLGIAYLVDVHIGCYVEGSRQRDWLAQSKVVEGYANEVRRAALDLPPGATISIYNHPLRVNPDFKWAYNQLMTDMLVPGRGTHVEIDKVTSATQRTYTFMQYRGEWRLMRKKAL